MKIGAVVVAAGMSSRMGTFKPILEVGQFSMVRRILSTLSNAGACPIVLVTGNRASELEQHVAGLDVVCLRNENYENSQMFDSAKIGLTHLLGTCDKVLFAPVDIPLFSVDTVRRLLNSERAFAFPVYGGRKGHPLMISGTALPQRCWRMRAITGCAAPSAARGVPVTLLRYRTSVCCTTWTPPRIISRCSSFVRRCDIYFRQIRVAKACMKNRQNF